MWTYNYTPTSDELYHHGIKGQKWGVRRYQNTDGSLTPAGKKRYSDGEPSKSKHRLKLEDRFKKAGLSDEEAAKQADKRIRTEKILAAVGITTVAVATAYAVRNHLKDKSDSLIKAGESLQRIETTSDGKLYDAFYVARDKSDKIKYAGKLGLIRRQQEGRAYLMDIGVKGDIKVAGKDTAFETFKKLCVRDNDFLEAMVGNAESPVGMGVLNVHGGNPNRGDLKKLYENFNTRLVYGGAKSAGHQAAVSKFYDALKSKGYGAIQDLNDKKFSGFRAKNPLIVFGQSGNVAVKTVRELGESEITKNLAKNGVMEVGKMLSSTAAMTIPVATISSMSLSDDQVKTIAKSAKKS